MERLPFAGMEAASVDLLWPRLDREIKPFWIFFPQKKSEFFLVGFEIEAACQEIYELSKENRAKHTYY
jgi:hypothetical protein